MDIKKKTIKIKGILDKGSRELFGHGDRTATLTDLLNGEYVVQLRRAFDIELDELDRLEEEARAKGDNFTVELDDIDFNGDFVFSSNYDSIDNDLIFYAPVISEKAQMLRCIHFNNIKTVKGYINFGGCENLKLINFGKVENISGHIVLPSKSGECNVKIIKSPKLDFTQIRFSFIDESGKIDRSIKKEHVKILNFKVAL